MESEKKRVTPEAILALRVVIEESIERGQKTFIGFLDLEKAFDNVKWSTMLEGIWNEVQI